MPAVDLGVVERLDEKIRQLIALVEKTRAEATRLRSDNERLTRDVESLQVQLTDAAGVATARIVADAFCHNMVRALVGCLLAVGEGRKPPDWPAEVLAGRRRDAGVGVVHAHGLTLEEVGYPGVAELAAQATRARARRQSVDV